MKTRLVPLALAAVAVAVAAPTGIAVGSPHTLSKASVKKVATQAVQKAAPGLSVASAVHATSADSATTAATAARAKDADTLHGLDSTALQSGALQYALPSRAATGGEYVWTLPGLAPGDYVASYTMLLESGATATTNLICEFTDATRQGAQVFTYGAHNDPFMSASATGVLSYRSDIVLVCNNSTTGSHNMDGLVTLQPLDRLTKRTAG